MKNFRDRYTIINGIPTILPAKIDLETLLAPEVEIDLAIDALAAARAAWEPKSMVTLYSDSDPNWYS
jgi:hypothetical protein